MVPRFWPVAVGGLALSLGVPLPAAPGASGIGSGNVVQPSRNPAPSPPVNASVGIALIRFRPSRPLPEAELVASRTWADLFRRMTNHGRADVIHRAVRDIVCAPSAHLEFRQLESRPAFTLDTGSPLPQTNVFGLSLATDVRWLPAAGPGDEPWVLVEWKGGWTGSVQLYSRWEALAVRAFSAAKTLPGITYDRMEEDEDGFVNTGGTTDFGGLFRRRKTRQKADKPTGGAPGKAPARAAASGSAPQPKREPDYLDATVMESVALSGQRLCPAGEMIIRRHPLSTEPDAGELILVLTIGAGQ